MLSMLTYLCLYDANLHVRGDYTHVYLSYDDANVRARDDIFCISLL